MCKFFLFLNLSNLKPKVKFLLTLSENCFGKFAFQFNFPQLTRAKIVIRTFVLGGHKHLKTHGNAIIDFIKVIQKST